MAVFGLLLFCFLYREVKIYICFVTRNWVFCILFHIYFTKKFFETTSKLVCSIIYSSLYCRNQRFFKLTGRNVTASAQ